MGSILILSWMKTFLNQHLNKKHSTPWACHQIQECCPLLNLRKRKSYFRNHDKVTDRRTELFLAIILYELLAAREPEWGFQSLAVHPPTWQALGMPKAWDLGTSVLFDLRSSTSFPRWTEESVRHHMKSVVPFFRNYCCPCLQTPTNSVPQKRGLSFLPCPFPPDLACPLSLSQSLDLEGSSPLSWLLGAEWMSWQENMQVSAWQI